MPISTRFQLRLLKKSQFLQSFTDTETYDYASEFEKPYIINDKKRNTEIIDASIDKNTYNLRSSDGKTERRVFTEKSRKPRKTFNLEEVTKANMKKDPLAPIIEEIKNIDTLKSPPKANLSKGGDEINKIAEKLKNLIKRQETEKLDTELLSCTEVFENNKENSSSTESAVTRGTYIFLSNKYFITK